MKRQRSLQSSDSPSSRSHKRARPGHRNWIISKNINREDRHQLLRDLLLSKQSQVRENHTRISFKGINSLNENKEDDLLHNYRQIRQLGRGSWGETRLYEKNGLKYAVKQIAYDPFETFDIYSRSPNLNDPYFEVIIAILLSGKRNALRLKKVLFDPIKSNITMISEVLEQLVEGSPAYDAYWQDQRLQQRSGCPEEGLHYDDRWELCRYGVTVLDRKADNVMCRRNKFVHIDYGIVTVDWQRFRSYLKIPPVSGQLITN